MHEESILMYEDSLVITLRLRLNYKRKPFKYIKIVQINKMKKYLN